MLINSRISDRKIMQIIWKTSKPTKKGRVTNLANSYEHLQSNTWEKDF